MSALKGVTDVERLRMDRSWLLIDVQASGTSRIMFVHACFVCGTGTETVPHPGGLADR